MLQKRIIHSSINFIGNLYTWTISFKLPPVTGVTGGKTAPSKTGLGMASFTLNNVLLIGKREANKIIIPIQHKYMDIIMGSIAKNKPIANNIL
jgi:hypothetical protein